MGDNVDNFEKIQKLLNFTNKNALYTVNIFQRRKDIPDLSKQSKLIKTYFIRTIDDFVKCKESIVTLCGEKKARAYIDLNARDTEKVALYALKKTADHIANKEYDAVKNVYLDACGNSPVIYTKLWMADVDTKDTEILKGIINEENILDIIPTKNGYHIICHPFPLNKWEKIENVDIIKHCCTLLYM